MKYLFLFVSCFLSLNLQAQATIIEDDFNPSDWAVIIEDNMKLGILNIIPEKIIDTKYFQISSTDNLVLNNETETESKVRMSLTAYDEDNVPIELDVDNLEIEFEGVEIDFESETYFETGLNSTFTFILDDSGSMSGANMQELLTAFAGFSNDLQHDSMYCRIMWFSSTYEYHGDDWKQCNDSFFTSIVPRGEYGGTQIQEGFDRAVTDLVALDKNKTNKYIIVVSDGGDSSDVAQLQTTQSNATTDNVSTFGYIVGGATTHTYSTVFDFFISKDAPISSFFPSYLSGISNQIVNENYISVDKESMNQ